MRREERVTVQGPVKEQQPDGMSHRGARSSHGTLLGDLDGRQSWQRILQEGTRIEQEQEQEPHQCSTGTPERIWGMMGSQHPATGQL